MKFRILGCGLLLSVLPLGGAFGLTVETFELRGGWQAENTIAAPVLNGEGVGTIRIDELEAAYDEHSFVVYRLNKGIMKSKPTRPKPHYKMAPGINLAAFLTEALRGEAENMGFQLADQPQGEPAWIVSGKLHDIEVELQQIMFGATMFYGHMDVELTVENSEGTTKSFRLDLHDMHQAYNAGFGLQDEVKMILARFLIEIAQEIVARLNRELFKAPPHSRIAETIDTLNRKTDEKGAGVLAVGLSGDPAAVPVLLELLETTKDEDYRADIINALANIGSREVVEVLRQRYKKEDEDCRFYTLKAMAYIGTDEGLELVKERGTKDRNLATQILAHRILAARN